jgi:large subunit ribosomal protein L24e
MPTCSFCKKVYEFPRGLTLVLNDGNILYLCSSKCRKNMLHLKRDNKKVNWVRKAEIEEKQEKKEEKI